MERKGVIQLVVIFLGFSFAFSCLAAPSSRSLIRSTAMEDGPSIQELLKAQDRLEMRENGEVSNDGKRMMMEGRMDIESNDYPGTGPNDHHDPKTPARM